ncbi:type II restriction endonuclease [Thiolapillus sp.]|uniref:type II restriction endonuclease n=1 Tax=Thiolapillus sp. TaxID=2017437 RepID=UPI003AF6BD90
MSTAQTDEMRGHRLQLVVPEPLAETYTTAQRDWLLDLRSFCEIVSEVSPFSPDFIGKSLARPLS